MKRLISLITASVLAISASAQEKCPEIRKDHPRIFFNSDTWPEVLARAEGPARGYRDALLKECDKMTDNPVCGYTGPVVRMPKKASDGSFISTDSMPIDAIKEFGKQAAKCALAWRFTGDAKYLEKARRMLKVSVDAYTDATKNLHPVDWFAFNRLNAICAYDWIYEGLTDGQRREIIVPLVEHVRLIQPEAGLKIPRQPPGSKTTGFYGMASLLWYAGLAADGDGYCDEVARKMLEKGYRLFLEVIENRNATAGDDGGLISVAVNYSLYNYPFAHFNFFRSHVSATGVDIAPRYPAMALFPYWVWWTWIRDGERPKVIRYAGASDTNHYSNTFGGEYMYEHLSNYMACFKDCAPEAAAFTAALREWMPSQKITDIFPATPFLVDTDAEVDPKYAAAITDSPLKARHFETMGQILMRSGWEPDATYCTFTAGAEVIQHKHYDENNFIIYKYDHLALDTGERARQKDLNLTYYYAQSVAHNVVLIQKPGEKLPSYWGSKTNAPGANINYGGQVNHTSAKVLAFETGDDFTYVASDATACYGSKAEECVRQFVFVYPDWFIVYDRVVSSDAAYEKDWLLHFKNRPEIKGNLIKADSRGGRLYCQALLPKDAKFDLIGGPGKEFWVRDRNFEIDPAFYEKSFKDAEGRGYGPYFGAWRIEEKPAVAAESDRFLNVLTATSSDGGKPVKAKLVQDGARDGVVLSLKGRKMTFWFNREGTVGGEVVIGKTARRPLTDKVQPQEGILL